MNRIYSIILVLVAAGSLWLAGRQHAPLLQMRREYRLNWEEPLQNAPPLVSFTTVALGGFRGIIADALWLRTAKLQEEQKYFELVQLADWITKLEPRFAMVWAFHGWNLAYNISVMLDNPADRWRWVKHGIELMRDEGLVYNPGDPNLHRELGWIFQHKLGNILDQAHLFYKRAWAAEMGELFDGPRPDYAFALANPADPRVKRLREQYKLEPGVMQAVDAEYGPLDWRLPAAHAIYWAYRGRPYAQGFDRVQLDRMIFQSLQDNFWSGRLVVEPAENIFTPAPNPDAFATVNRAYQIARTAHPDEDTLAGAHRNFLKDAIVVLYVNHYTSEARAAFEALREQYPEATRARSFEAFVRNEFREQMQQLGQREALALVTGLLSQATYWIVAGEDDRWQGAFTVARYCWQEYMKTRTDDKLIERTGLPPFSVLWQTAKEQAALRTRGAAAKARLEAAKELPAEPTR